MCRSKDNGGSRQTLHRITRWRPVRPCYAAARVPSGRRRRRLTGRPTAPPGSLPSSRQAKRHSARRGRRPSKGLFVGIDPVALRYAAGKRRRSSLELVPKARCGSSSLTVHLKSCGSRVSFAGEASALVSVQPEADAMRPGREAVSALDCSCPRILVPLCSSGAEGRSFIPLRPRVREFVGSKGGCSVRAQTSCIRPPR